MKSSILFRLSVLLCFSTTAVVGQGRLFLANDWAGKYVPIMILDPETDEAFGPFWPDWRLEVRAGPKRAKDLQPLRTNDFQPFFNAGSFYPFPLTVPDVPAGEEATVQLLVFHRERPAVKVPIGSYDVALSGPNERGPTVPPEGPGITNVAPKEWLDLLPRRPAIPGEPKYKGKPLSYWFSGFFPGLHSRIGRRAANGGVVMQMRPRVWPGPGNQGQPVAVPQDAEDDGIAALRAAGAAGIPVLLQYSAPDKMITGMVVRRVYQQFVRMGLREQAERLALASLRDTNPVVVCNALILFPCTAAESETPRLIEFVRAGPREIRSKALQALYRCKAVNPELLPLYRTCLENGDTSDQGTILRSLKAYGPTAKPLLPAIEPLLEATSWMLQVPAAAALWAIDGRTNFLPGLVREFEEQQRPGDFGFLSEALRLFAEMGPAAKPAVPALLKAFEPRNQGPGFGGFIMLRREAEETLKKIEPGSEEKLPPDPVRRFPRPMPGPMPEMPAMPFG